MRVLIVEPLNVPVVKDIPGPLESMQEIVGGVIQAVYPFEEPVALICNDEGKLLNLPMNRYVPTLQDIIAGTFIVCGLSGENFASLIPEQIERYQNLFANPEVFLKTPHGILILEAPSQ